MRARFILFAGLLAGLLFAAAPATAATTQIGAVAEIDANQAPDPGTSGNATVQAATAAGHSYAVPSGFGVITAWRHRTGTTSGPLAFKVYRATGNPDEFVTIGADPRTVTAGQTHRFDVRIKVNPGDVIGLSAPSGMGNVQEAYSGGPGDDVGVFDPDPAVGTTATLAGGANGYLLDVAAVLETDADGDGYGDDTQDTCPTDPAKQDCVLPESTIDKGPKKTVKTTRAKAKVKFAFSSTEVGTTFECKIDRGAFKPCTSPKKKKFKPGKHKFAVRATDAAGNTDATPAKRAFKVKRV